MARQKGWVVEGQQERGEEGTLHYQLIVKTPQVRFSAVKKAFPRSHIELARNVQALEAYVKKEDTREGVLQASSDMYPSLQKMWDLLAEYVDSKYTKGQWMDLSGDSALDVFDRFIHAKILEGYVVETMAVNPQMRSCVKNYFYPIICRSLSRRKEMDFVPVDRQTDRQTDETLIPDIDINARRFSQDSSSQASLDDETFHG